MTNVFPRVLSVSAALILGGCATHTSQVDSPPAAPVTAAKAVRDDLPNLALEPSVMYDVLAGEIAMQRGQVGVAAQTLGRAAQRTRAERAKLFFLPTCALTAHRKSSWAIALW